MKLTLHGTTKTIVVGYFDHSEIVLRWLNTKCCKNILT